MAGVIKGSIRGLGFSKTMEERYTEARLTMQQGEIAKAAGVPGPWLSQLLNKHTPFNPVQPKVVRLMAYFKLTPDEGLGPEALQRYRDRTGRGSTGTQQAPASSVL